jgi:tetratricopeptide (TPR) repeat protein
MSRIGNVSQRVLLGVALFAGAVLTTGAAFAQGGQQPQSPGYNRDEYDRWMACRTEKVPQQKIKCLDEFVAKSPTAAGPTALGPYIASDYMNAYLEVKDWAKTIEAADKILALGEKVTPADQLTARLTRAVAFISGAAQMQTPDKLNAARDSARQGLKDLANLQKPEGASQADWDTLNKQRTAYFATAIATASDGLKDNPGIVESYKALAAIEPTEPSYWYKIGRAYLSMTPPQTLDGLWAIARSVSLKGPNEAQIHDYLKKLVASYQQAACDKLVDDEVNQMITLAAGSPDRPATFTLYTADDLNKARTDTTNFIPYLREGGEHGRLMWLAVCGLDYPEIVTKLISIDTPEVGPAVLHTFTGVTGDETKDGTVADMEVKLDGTQPDVKRIPVNDELRFGATLVGYDQTPFMLHWEKGKVNPEDIPAETGKKPAPKKKPGGAK